MEAGRGWGMVLEGRLVAGKSCVIWEVEKERNAASPEREVLSSVSGDSSV